MKIEQGQRVPFWYGFAWYQYNDMTAQFYPLPFNFIVRWLRVIYFKVSIGKADDREEMAFKSGYTRGEKYGYQQGLREGKKIGIQENQERIEKNLKELEESLKSNRTLIIP